MAGPIGWETVSCPLCGANRERELLVVPAAEGRPFRLVGCGACGLAYLNPRPDVASIGHFYPDDYHAYHGGHDLDTGAVENLGPRARRALAWRTAPARDSFTAIPYCGQGRLLDVGCGSGWYAARMRGLGWDVVGLDFSAFAAAQATRRYGIRTLVGTLPHGDIAPESFDAITMGMVLEHVHDPHRMIAAAVKALRPGGLLAIAVPNFASLGYRIFGADWWGLDLPLHLLHFTPTTLLRLVAAHGLAVRECRLIPRRSWLGKSARKAKERGSPASRTLFGRLARIRPVASLLSRWADWTGQSDSLFLLAQRLPVIRTAEPQRTPTVALGRRAAE
jgi:SAM-dependent methyltransferase